MHPLVYQTDFGLVDGAVSAMYGVAYCVEPNLKIHDLTHDITPYNVWEMILVQSSILCYTISDKEIKTSADTIARQLDMVSAFSFPKEKGRMLLTNAKDT